MHVFYTFIFRLVPWDMDYFYGYPTLNLGNPRVHSFVSRDQLTFYLCRKCLFELTRGGYIENQLAYGGGVPESPLTGNLFSWAPIEYFAVTRHPRPINDEGYGQIFYVLDTFSRCSIVYITVIKLTLNFA